MNGPLGAGDAPPPETSRTNGEHDKTVWIPAESTGRETTECRCIQPGCTDRVVESRILGDLTIGWCAEHFREGDRAIKLRILARVGGVPASDEPESEPLRPTVKDHLHRIRMAWHRADDALMEAAPAFEQLLHECSEFDEFTEHKLNSGRFVATRLEVKYRDLMDDLERFTKFFFVDPASPTDGSPPQGGE